MNKIILSNGKEIIKPIDKKKRLYTIIFIIFFFLSIWFTGFSFVELFENFDKFIEVIKDMLPPIGDPEELKEYFMFITEVWPELVITIQMAIVGTIIGSIIAFPVAVLASSNISSNKLSKLIKYFLSIIRTLPVLIYAMIFAYIFGLGEFAGAVAIVVFTFVIMTKMLYELIERVDMSPFEAAKANGLTNLNAFNLTVKPQIMPSFYSMTLYTFEINIKSAAVLGYVGAGGIGQQLNDAMSLRKYDEAGLIILCTIVVVLLIDMVTQKIRKEMI